MSFSTDHIITSLQDLYGDQVSSGDLRAWCAMNDVTYQTVSKRLKPYQVSRGKWDYCTRKLEQTFESPSARPAVEQNLIPAKDDTFVKFGNFSDKKIIQSRLFYPTFTGLSGNGKTFSVEQCVLNWVGNSSVNITIETDEDDLIKWSLLMVKPSGTMDQSLKHLNEVPLLLDEIDLSNKILCLSQP